MLSRSGNVMSKTESRGESCCYLLQWIVIHRTLESQRTLFRREDNAVKLIKEAELRDGEEIRCMDPYPASLPEFYSKLNLPASPNTLDL